MRKKKKVKEDLLKVAAFGLIRYTPQNDSPQIIFRKNRVATRYLQMDLRQYHQRKELFMQRVQKMVSYLPSSTCRSRTIGTYFGDEEAKECGICDNCLRKKEKDFTTEEFTAIAAAIRLQLSQQAVTAEQLVAGLSSAKKEKTWKVLQFLQAEKEIAANSEGILYNK